MHRMPQLVEAVDLCLPEAAFRVEGTVLEKKPDLVAGADEVIIRLVFITSCREDAAYVMRIEFVDEFQCALPQLDTGPRGHEITQHNDARLVKGRHHVIRQHAIRRSGKCRNRVIHFCSMTSRRFSL